MSVFRGGSYVATRVLCVTLNGQFFQMFGADTNKFYIDALFSDVVWYDLSVTESTAVGARIATI